MTKYVIDLPEGVKFIVGKGYMMLSEKELLRIPVENLQEYNAPTVAENATVEKRVIELPAYVITELKTIKEDNGNDNLQGFMNDVNDDDEIWQCVEEFNYSVMPTDALLGEWWLEHVEFVNKPDPKYMVEVDMHDEYGNLRLAHVWQNDKHGAFTPYIDDGKLPSLQYNYKQFSEKDADMLVNEFSILKARKVKVED